MIKSLVENTSLDGFYCMDYAPKLLIFNATACNYVPILWHRLGRGPSVSTDSGAEEIPDLSTIKHILDKRECQRQAGRRRSAAAASRPSRMAPKSREKNSQKWCYTRSSPIKNFNLCPHSLTISKVHPKYTNKCL